MIYVNKEDSIIIALTVLSIAAIIGVTVMPSTLTGNSSALLGSAAFGCTWNGHWDAGSVLAATSIGLGVLAFGAGCVMTGPPGWAFGLCVLGA